MLRQILPFLLVSILSTSCVGEAPAVSSMEEELTLTEGFFRQDLDVPSPSGSIHTVVVARARALLRHDRRLVIMLPGTLANGGGYFDVASGTGYNAAEILADEGYIVVLPDVPGSGETFRPADGRDTGVEVVVSAIRRVATVYRLLFGIRHGVDIYGETGAGTPAVLLLAREPWVRTVSASAPFYQQFGPFSAVLFDPGYHAFLDSLPTGYLPQFAPQIESFFGPSDPVVRAEAVAACVGPMPQEIGTGAFYDLRDHLGPDSAMTLRLASPIVAAEPARAPALFLQGSPDPMGSEAGTAEMVAAYGATGGGEAEVVTISGASHLMRFDLGLSDGPESVFWSAELEFLASH